MFSYLEFIQILCRLYRKYLDQYSHYIQTVWIFGYIFGMHIIDADYVWSMHIMYRLTTPSSVWYG